MDMCLVFKALDFMVPDLGRETDPGKSKPLMYGLNRYLTRFHVETSTKDNRMVYSFR